MAAFHAQRLVVAHADRRAVDLGLEAHPDLARGAAADHGAGGWPWPQAPTVGGRRRLAERPSGRRERLLVEREGGEAGGQDGHGHEPAAASGRA